MRRVYERPLKRMEKTTVKEQQDLLADLLLSFQMIREPLEVAQFVQDLFTRGEVKHLAKRLRIAKLLLAGHTYEYIERDVHTSHGTLAKVAAWLADRGEGFRRVIAKLPKEEVPREESSWAPVVREWNTIKRRYPRYFWPELLLEEVVKFASDRQKEQLRSLLTSVTEGLEEKHDLHRHLEDLLSEPYKRKAKSTTLHSNILLQHAHKLK
ncbi:MAG: YerC/YecD family TrpR-related protein [Patescibacteria group bacterium]